MLPEKLSVLDTAEPLFLISKLTGYSLFSIERKNFRARFSKIDFLAIFLAVCVNLGLNCIYWKSIISVDAHVNDISKMSLPILIYADYLITVAAILWSFFNNRGIAELLRLFKEIDDDLREIGGRIDYQEQRMKILKSVAFTVTGIAFVIIFDYAVLIICNFAAEKLFAILIFWSIFCVYVQVHNHVAVLFGMKRRIQEVNKLLLQKDTDIQKLCKVHFHITQLVPIFNRIFSPIMLMFFTSAFAWSCISIFDVVTMPGKFWTVSIGLALVIISHCILEVLIVIIVIFAVENVKSELRKVAETCFQILNEFCGNERLCEDVTKFLNQVNGLEVKFTGWLIDFDWKTLFQFVTACIMYFVILVQFQGNFGGSQDEKEDGK